MPKRKRYAKRKRRASYKRKRRPRRARLTSRNVPSGMPTQRLAKLRYVDIFNITCTTGTLNSYIFRANGCFDPNQSSTGHQPLGFDQWALLFNHYVVLGSRITVTATPADLTGQSPGHVGNYLTDGKSTPYSTSRMFIEARKGTVRAIVPRQAKAARFSNKFSAKGFFGVTDVKDNITHLGAAVTADPTEEAYFTTWYQTSDNSTDTMSFTATIDYIVAFSEPKDLAQST
jgi:hypothetical protein